MPRTGTIGAPSGGLLITSLSSDRVVPAFFRPFVIRLRKRQSHAPRIHQPDKNRPTPLCSTLQDAQANLPGSTFWISFIPFAVVCNQGRCDRNSSQASKLEPLQ